MKRLVKWLAFIIVGLLAVVVIATAVLPNVINWNNYKPEIADAVRNATGRAFRIDGDIRISMWPDLDFSISGIHLANAPGAAPADMVSVGSVAGKVALWPLLSKELDIATLAVKNASVHLAVDKDGRPNWEMGAAKQAPAKPSAEPSAAEAKGAGMNFRLGEFKLEGSDISYEDDTTGQKIVARDINLTTAMSDPARPFSVNGQMTVNAEVVKLDLVLDSPQRLLDGQKATAKLNVASKWLNASYDGTARQHPTPGLDGTFDLNIPSVGQLAAWLGRPLDRTRPDPGMLRVRAEFASDGAKTVLKEATVQGSALSAKATGSLDTSTAVKKIALNLESGELDIDRYLPPPSPKSAASRATPSPANTAPKRDPLAALSDQPLDLGSLKGLDADIKVTIGEGWRA